MAVSVVVPHQLPNIDMVWATALLTETVQPVKLLSTKMASPVPYGAVIRTASRTVELYVNALSVDASIWLLVKVTCGAFPVPSLPKVTTSMARKVTAAVRAPSTFAFAPWRSLAASVTTFCDQTTGAPPLR